MVDFNNLNGNDAVEELASKRAERASQTATRLLVRKGLLEKAEVDHGGYIPKDTAQEIGQIALITTGEHPTIKA